MKENGCTVLVTSCDAYRDVERPFVSLFRKHWPDCPFALVLLTETATENDDRIDTANGFDRIIATGLGKNW